jgi:hypothetical protein
MIVRMLFMLAGELSTKTVDTDQQIAWNTSIGAELTGVMNS